VLHVGVTKVEHQSVPPVCCDEITPLPLPTTLMVQIQQSTRCVCVSGELLACYGMRSVTSQ